MEKLYDMLLQDCRFTGSLTSCINCGTCTAICPAAEFYDYDPRKIINIVQSKDETEIEKLLKSETIWYCGECLSCTTRCPRNNSPGLVVMALRSLSQRLGYFAESEKGRQQFALNKMLGTNILKYGYCVYPRTFHYDMFPEAGKVWKWQEKHLEDVYARLGANLDGEGPGPLRKIPKEDLDDLKKIFDRTGATAIMDKINKVSKEIADKEGLTEDEYFHKVFTETKKNHLNKK